MGGADSKLDFRKAVIQLTTKTQPIEANEDGFWNQFWADTVTSVQDVFALVPAAEIRALREESPSNLATLCYKAVEQLVRGAENSCASGRQQEVVLNCVRLLTRVLPYIFEDPDWRGFFWSTLPGQLSDNEGTSEGQDGEAIPLAQSLLNSIADLLFCPDFTVSYQKKPGPDKPDDPQSIDSCEFIWEAGVGFASSPPKLPHLEHNRTEILKLLLTCFSEAMYLPPVGDAHTNPNPWLTYFCSSENRHALPLFTSLLNSVCAYDPVGYGIPYNHLMFADNLEPLVEVASQLLVVTLDHDTSHGLHHPHGQPDGTLGGGPPISPSSIPEVGREGGGVDNLFVNYLSRIHREEDFKFILNGITRLLNNPLVQTYLPGSMKRVQFHQELLVLFWKMCDVNKKFLFYVLKSSDVLEVLVPILYHLNDSRADQSRVGLMHIGVFIMLLLSGERNFGVRLNKPYNIRVPMDIPVFTGTHADFLIIVFHKIITTGHQRLQPLFDCLLTIVVNVSPYLKTLSMVAANKLLHLLEAFSTPWFLYSSPNNHHLVFFLLEVFNNIIQYQFDGNSNLVYTIIRKRNVFYQLANLPTDQTAITKAMTRKQKINSATREGGGASAQPGGGSSPAVVSAGGASEESMEGSRPATDAQPGTMKATLPATPAVDTMTEKSEILGAAPTEALATTAGTHTVQPANRDAPEAGTGPLTISDTESLGSEDSSSRAGGSTYPQGGRKMAAGSAVRANRSPPSSPTSSVTSDLSSISQGAAKFRRASSLNSDVWRPSSDWIQSWKHKLPLQTIMRLLQVLVPQVEKICIDKGLTDESEILKFLQHGTLVGLLPVPHPILIRKYQANSGTTMWFRTYMWGIIYLRNVDPPIWYDTDVKLFEVQRVKDRKD